MVPFRDFEPRQNRGKQLTRFLQHMEGVLNRALGCGTWAIIILQQCNTDGHKFARGRVLNAGARLSAKWFPAAVSWVLHDVDLLPDEARAAAFATVSPSCLRTLNADSPWYRTLDMYIGGICAVCPASFMACNGFQNGFEGWGGEDDCFRNAFLARVPGATLEPVTTGSVLDMEYEGRGPGSYRCATDPDAQCAKIVRRRIKDEAARNGYMRNGVNELCFELLAIHSHTGPVIHVEIDVFNTHNLPYGWTSDVTSSHGTLFYRAMSETAMGKQRQQLYRPLPSFLESSFVDPLVNSKPPLQGPGIIQACWAGWAATRDLLHWFPPADDMQLIVQVAKVLGLDGPHMPVLETAIRYLKNGRTAPTAPVAASAAPTPAAPSAAPAPSGTSTPAAPQVLSTSLPDPFPVVPSAAASVAASAMPCLPLLPVSSPIVAAPVTAPVTASASSLPSEAPLYAFPIPKGTPCTPFPCGQMPWAEAKAQLRNRLDVADSIDDPWVLHCVQHHICSDVFGLGTPTVRVKNRRIYAGVEEVCIPFTSLRAHKK